MLFAERKFGKNVFLVFLFLVYGGIISIIALSDAPDSANALAVGFLTALLTAVALLLARLIAGSAGPLSAMQAKGANKNRLIGPSKISMTNIMPEGDFTFKEFGGILGAINEGVLVIRPSGMIVFANQAAAKLSGFGSPENMTGLSLMHLVNNYSFFSETETAAVSSKHILKLMAEQAKNGGSLVLKAVDKRTEKVVWLEAGRLHFSAGQDRESFWAFIFRDITKDRQAEELGRQKEEERMFFTKLSAELATVNSIKQFGEALKRIAAVAVETVADWVVLEMQASGRLRRELYEKKFANGKPQEIKKVLLGDIENIAAWEDLVQKNESPLFFGQEKQFELPAYFTLLKYYSFVKPDNLSSLVFLPIRFNGKAFGVMAFGNMLSRPRSSATFPDLFKEISKRLEMVSERCGLLEHMKKTAQLEHENAIMLDTLLSKAPVGFAMLDEDCRFLKINDILAEMNGVPAEDHIGKTVKEVVPDVADFVEKIVKRVKKENKPVLDYEFMAETKAQPGRKRYWLESFYPVHSSQGRLLGIGVIVNEITRRKEIEERMHYQAYHDPLTGLPNRKYFDEYLNKELHKSKRHNGKLAVLFIDMDRLKDINDTLGHYVGDLILKETAARLQEAIKGPSLLARWGGDEFVVFAGSLESSAAAANIAAGVLASIEPAIRVQNHTLHITASIGIAVFPDDGEDTHSLLKNADSALYRAKEAGRNRFELYNHFMNVNNPQRLALENDLRLAIKNNEFILFYQPILDLKSRNILAVETLLRWNHPRFGLLSPSRFLPIAEEAGLMVPVGKLVLTQSVRYLKNLHDKGLKISMGINASAPQFTEAGFAEEILTELKTAGINPVYMEVEVTETVAMENLGRTREILKQLQEAGVGVTVDDFGTGYSSLSYLKRFPIHKLKIDRSFVRNCITDEQDTSIIKAIISMARSLRLKVVAEGVDTEMQLNLLASLGCDEAQGYYISRPLSSMELEIFLQERVFSKKSGE